MTGEEGFGASRKRPLLLGHRGARLGVPENSFAAFDKALGDGCDGFEFDVRLTADFHCVICHDPGLFGFDLAGTGFAELQAACAQPPRRGGGRELCTLEEVLARYASRAYLDIELKVCGAEAAAVALLKQFPALSGAVVSSFLPSVITSFAELDPTASLGLIFDDPKALRQWDSLPVSHLMPRYKLIDRVLMNEFHAAGKQVFAWTVNHEREMRRLAELGVDGLISDDTRLLSDVFAGDKRS